MKTHSGPITHTGSNRGRQFLIYGRALPTDKNASPAVIVVKVIAPNEPIARSRFWKLNKREHKLKRSHGEILKVQEVHDKSKTITKNFGIFLKYRSHTGVHNMFKEYRDVSMKGAIDQMYNEIAGNYKASAERVEIIKTTELKKEELKVRNPRCLQWIDTENIQYPLWRKTARPTHQRYSSLFAKKRPVIFKTGLTIDK